MKLGDGDRFDLIGVTVERLVVTSGFFIQAELQSPMKISVFKGTSFSFLKLSRALMFLFLSI